MEFVIRHRFMIAGGATGLVGALVHVSLLEYIAIAIPNLVGWLWAEKQAGL